MKRKPKIVCALCGLVVALKTNGLIPRHRPRWREGPNSMSAPVCVASDKTPADAASLLRRFQDAKP